MKKFFTSMAMAAVLGTAVAGATTVNISFVGNPTDLGAAPYTFVTAESLTSGVTFPEIKGQNVTFNFNQDVQVQFTPKSGYDIYGAIFMAESYNGGYTKSGDGIILTLQATSINNNITIEIPIQKKSDEEQELFYPIPVNFTIPSEATGMIETLTFLGETQTFPANANPNGYEVTFNRNAGLDAQLSIGFRKDNAGNPVYNLGSIMATYTTNDSKEIFSTIANGTNSGATVVIPSQANEVNIALTISDPNKNYIEYTMNVNYPEGLLVTNNETSDSDPNYVGVIPIEDTTNVIKLENNAYDMISLSAKTGYKIVSVKNSLGAEISYSRIAPTDGMVINVTLETVAVTYQNFTVTFEADAFDSAYYTTDGTTQNALNVDGTANSIQFDPAQGEYYRIVATPKDAENIYVFTDGISFGGQPANAAVYYGRPSNGLSLSVYASKPEAYNLTVSAPDGTYSFVNVTVNGKALANQFSASGHLILAGATVTISAPSYATVVMNDDEQTASETVNSEAIYNYTMSQDMSFVISDPSGVDRIDAAVDGERVIYDLNGRRVNGEPKKGVYIINGKKVILK